MEDAVASTRRRGPDAVAADAGLDALPDPQPRDASSHVYQGYPRSHQYPSGHADPTESCHGQRPAETTATPAAHASQAVR